MALNVVVLFFFGFLAWLLYKFKLKKTFNPKEVKDLLLVFGVFGFFLVINTLLAYFAYHGYVSMVNKKVIRYLEELQVTEDMEPVMVEGFLASENKTMSGSYIAYLDGTRLYSPDTITLNLKDGKINSVGRIYSAKGWEIDYHKYRFISSGMAVMIAGKLKKIMSKKDNEVTVKRMYIEPDIIYSGTHAMMKARVKKFIPISIILTVLNLIASLLVIGFPLYHFYVCTIAYRGKQKINKE